MRIPNQDNFSTRCRISHRPPFRVKQPVFYRCECCGSVTVITRPVPENDQSSASADSGCSEQGAADRMISDANLPVIRCCGKDIPPLQVCRDPDLTEEHRIGYTLFGGFEKNAANIEIGGGIHPMTSGHRIEWIYVYGFQGGQLKYLPQGLSSKCNVAFADEDAYAYCDRPICRMGREHCQFQCKRGLVFYAYCSRHGLFRLEI